MTTGTSAEAARVAFSRGLLASGVSVNGLMASHNQTVAAKMFAAATEADPSMCDAWLARVIVGDDSVEVLGAAWQARETLGMEIRRLQVLASQFSPMVFDGVFLRLEITSQDSLAICYAAALAREGRYREADELLAEVRPDDPFDVDMHTYISGQLYFRGQRWPDVLRCFPAEKRWRRPSYGCAAAAMAATALASLGVFEDAYRRAKGAIEVEHVPAAATIALYTQAMCLRHLGKEEDAAQLLRRVYSRDAGFTPARQALDDPTRRLVITDPETIEARSDPWDPASAPTAKEAEAARHAEEAASYLAEGEAELEAMLGMAEPKRQVKLFRATTLVNQARAKVGLPVPVASRHTLLVGPPGCGKTTVARALTKQLCGLGVLRRPAVIETNKSRLVGNHLGESENNTKALLESALGAAVFIDEMHNLYDQGYSHGDPYGTAIIETLLPYMENHRDELVVFGAGYPKAMERMLTANQGLRRRFATTIRFESYTPQELWQLTRLMGEQNKDIIADSVAEVLLPMYTRYYNEQSVTPEGDVIRGIDWLGNGGFVRNVVERARDHRNNRLLDTADLELLLASGDVRVSEQQMQALRELTGEDFAEGVATAVADAQRDRVAEPDWMRERK
jgi:type VII secretion ATPase EccA